MLTGSSDGTARLWSAKTGDELACLISFTSGGWAVVDPNGRFDTSDLDGGAALHWTVEDDPTHSLPLEVFMRDYYTPRLLSRIMNGEELPPLRSVAEIKNRVQPDVSIDSVSGSKTHPGRADVIVRAASHTDEKGQGSGLQDLRLFRNGQLVGYREGVLSDAAKAVPTILQSGTMDTHRGLIPVGKPEQEVPSIQTPAVFDFSKQDTLVRTRQFETATIIAELPCTSDGRI